MAAALEIVLHAAASAVAAASARAEAAEGLPTQSRDEVLSDLLNATPQTRAQLVHRHEPGAGDRRLARRGAARLRGARRSARGRGALRLPGARPARQHGAAGRARVGGFLARGAHRRRARPRRQPPRGPGAAAAGRVARQMDDVLAGLGNRLPATLIRCGVGTRTPARAGCWPPSPRRRPRRSPRARRDARTPRSPSTAPACAGRSSSGTRRTPRARPSRPCSSR